MTILFVRHASAGDRKEWNGEDGLRPLDELGRRQAEGLVDLLRPHRPSRVLSSSSLRCRETVEPLARALGLTVEERVELAERASADGVQRVAAQLQDDVVVFCTHGDVVAEVLGEESEKGSAWILIFDGTVLAPVEYLPPSA
jgi:broad specificity phosphatase PhoE